MAAAQPSATPPTPAQPTAEVSEGILEDASIDRAYLAPTAINQPMGSWTINSYELLGLGATFGVTNNFQVSAAFAFPNLGGLIAAKLRLLSTGKLHLALHGSAILASDGIDFGSTRVAIAGAVATVCLDDSCRSLLTGYASAGFAMHSGDGDGTDASGASTILAASLIAEITDGLRFVGELDTGRSEEYLAWLGIRMLGSKAGVDLGVMTTPVIGEDDPLPVLPWVAVSYRSL
jgi:hypothetical protein